MKILCLVALVTLTVVAAHAEPFAKGDPNRGKELVGQSCTGCHVSLMGGDGSKIYTRPDRIVNNADQLLARVQVCNVNSGAGWFPEDELHAAAYLNQAFYKFK
jgi:mono/diheme cytochrome c family protein